MVCDLLLCFITSCRYGVLVRNTGWSQMARAWTSACDICHGTYSWAVASLSANWGQQYYLYVVCVTTEWVKIYEVLGTKFIKRWPISVSYHFITMCIMYHTIKNGKRPFFKKQELNYILLQHFLILKLLIVYPYLPALSFQTDLALVGKPTPRLGEHAPVCSHHLLGPTSLLICLHSFSFSSAFLVS